MSKVSFVIAALLAALTSVAAAPLPTITNAMDGIFAAFQTHALVGLGDTHRLAQQEDFYAALVRDPRFARDVGNVVVEFGGAAHQDIIDRYVAGEDVPYAELRKVWLDVVGWNPAVPALGYLNFYAQVRLVNLALPPEDRIHVWLGEPKIDWSQITTKADWQPLVAQRDHYAAEVINKNILAKKKKALVIYGEQHFTDPVSPAVAAKLIAAGWDPYSLKALVEKDHPHAFFVVLTYTGFEQKPCAADFEQSLQSWPKPALATPVRGTFLENRLRASANCFVEAPGGYHFPSALTATEAAQATAKAEDLGAGIGGDALLYLGPASSLSYSPNIPDTYLDLDTRREIAKHYRIITGQQLPVSNMENNPASPRPWRP